MNTFRLTQPHPYLNCLQTWYEETFPLSERRQFSELVRLLARPDMHCRAILHERQLVGFVIYWTLPDVLYIEHFVIAPAYRGQRLGQQVLEYVLTIPSAYHVLEVEHPRDQVSQRRIQFYERAGFAMAPYPYQQPPYRPNEPAVPMHLMTRPAIPNPDVFNHITALVRQRVYEPFV